MQVSAGPDSNMITDSGGRTIYLSDMEFAQLCDMLNKHFGVSRQT